VATVKRLLVANRGEIAARIIRSARELGIETVLAVSDVDEDSYAAQLADELALVGPAPASKSYLNSEALIRAAQEHGVDAVHPGYGFLSERASFARAVLDAGLTWVGPSPEAIELMGNKAAARAAARAAGVPVLAGSDGGLSPNDDVAAAADRIGFPLLIKASAGGGGRGIRVVREPGALLGEFKTAGAEALAAFGDATVYLERFIERARHIEVQILGDGSDVIHLFDRDCSVQRRQQKLIEEAPAPNLPDHLRKLMLDAAVQLARSCNYRGAGTVEFLYDEARDQVCFIEMNTRLQVEHPVTEMVTGVDLVREQLLIARGESLRFTQEDIVLSGHAIEVRLCAEDPAAGFMPSPGTVERLVWPGGPGVRVDSGVVAGSKIQPYYDSMIAKLVVWDSDRDSVVQRALRSLDEVQIEGIHTTLPFLRKVLADAAFTQVEHHTKMLEHRPDLFELDAGEASDSLPLPVP
jgi:acetyl-CoA carboxylase biotin carboxylase subunit